MTAAPFTANVVSLEADLDLNRTPRVGLTLDVLRGDASSGLLGTRIEISSAVQASTNRRDAQTLRRLIDPRKLAADCEAMVAEGEPELARSVQRQVAELRLQICEQLDTTGTTKAGTGVFESVMLEAVFDQALMGQLGGEVTFLDEEGEELGQGLHGQLVVIDGVEVTSAPSLLRPAIRSVLQRLLHEPEEGFVTAVTARGDVDISRLTFMALIFEATR